MALEKLKKGRSVTELDRRKLVGMSGITAGAAANDMIAADAQTAPLHAADHRRNLKINIV